MSRLRATYEQYFMGIERTPPHTQRKDVVRRIHQLENTHVRNTALKFKIRSMIQRFNSYKAYWRRVERQIEEGTYVRDIRRAERNRERRRQGAGSRDQDRQDDVVELDIDEAMELGDLQAELEKMEAEGAFEAKPSPESRQPSQPQGESQSTDERERIKQQKLAEIAGQLGIQKPEQASRGDGGAGSSGSASGNRRTGARRQKLSDIKKRFEQRTGKKVGSGDRQTSRPSSSRGGGGGGGGDDEARRVFDQLLEAKRRCNESTKGLTYDKLSKSMHQQREQLKKKRGAKDVEFKVVIKDGRAFLKPETK